MALRRPAYLSERGLRLNPVGVPELARLLNGLAEGDTGVVVDSAEAVEIAEETALAFWNRRDLCGAVRHSRAAVLLVPFDFEAETGPWRCLLRVKDPYLAMLAVLKQFHEPLVSYPESKIAWDAEIHPSAVVEGVVWPGARVGPGCVVMRGAELDFGVVLEAHVTVYGGVRIGRGTVVQAGAVLGSRGFGFAGDMVPVPHYAGVEIGENVEIGANTVVAAGFLFPTRVGNFCKIDTLVQIAHNCVLGDRVMMASGAALAGSAVLEDGVLIGGGAKVDGHLRIGRGARVAALSGVTKDVPPGITVAGFPARPIGKWRRQLMQRGGNDHAD